MNIIILMAGGNRFEGKDNKFPLYLTEFDGKPLLEYQVERCRSISGANLIFAVIEEEIRHYHLDNLIKLLDPNARLVSIKQLPRGSACTAMLCMPYIDFEKPLLVLSVDEFIMDDYNTIIKSLLERNLDAGTVTFSSVHPRYAYLALDKNDCVTEAAEKNPISRNAAAGFHFFAKGKFFVEAVQSMIRKDASVNGVFYVCPAFNEMILNQQKIGVWRIDKTQYFPIKTESQLEQFKNEFKIVLEKQSI
jgi:NDP-sugar pyrophosphorylase family protein